MMRLVDFVDSHHTKKAIDKVARITEEDRDLAKRINLYIETHDIKRVQELMDAFGMTRHRFYKMKNADLLNIPESISGRQIRTLGGSTIILSDEEVVRRVQEYLTKHPEASRTQLIRYGKVAGIKRLRALEQRGLVILPKKLELNRPDNAWKKFVITSEKARSSER